MEYRVAVIGATGRGGYGHQIDLSFDGVPGARVVAVADSDLDGARACAARTGAAAVYADYAEMLEKERPDIVAVCPRWCDQRVDMVLAAVHSGAKAILCEKPMAADLARADAIVEACSKAGVRMAVAHRRVSGYEIYAKRLIDEGTIGAVRMLKGYGKGDRRAGAEDFFVLGVHIMDSMRYFAGSDVVWAHGHITAGGRDVTAGDARELPEGIGPWAGDGVTAYYVFRNGVTGSYESYASDCPGSHRFGLDIYGETGIISLRDSPRGEMYLFPSGTWTPGEAGAWRRVHLPEWDNRPDGTPRSGKDWTLESNRMIAAEIVAALNEDRELQGVSTAADARAAIEMIQAAHVSALRKARVYLPLDVRRNPYAVPVHPATAGANEPAAEWEGAN